MKLGLQSKVLIPALVPVVICMALASYFSYEKASVEIWKGLIDSSKNIADSASQGLSIYIDGLKSITLTQSRNLKIVSMLDTENPTEEMKQSAHELLSELKNFDSSIQAATILNAHGETILSSDPHASGNFSERNYFQRAMKGEINISEPLMSKITGRPVLLVAAPVNYNGKTIGVLYARVDLGKFTEEIILTIKTGQAGYAFLADKSGMIFCHPDNGLILKYNISEQEWGKNILSKSSGVVDYVFEGIPKSVVFTKNKATGWIVAITVNYNDISLASSSVLKTTVLFSSIGIIIVSIVIFVIVRKLVFDLSHIVKFAGFVTEGHLDNRLIITRKDELGSLSESLNTMVAKLKEMLEISDAKSLESQRQTELTTTAMTEAGHAKYVAELKTESIINAANKLKNVVDIVTTASEDLSAQIVQSSKGAEEQSLRVVETATAMEEMNATVLEVAQNASMAAGAADQARTKAEDGAKVVGMVVNRPLQKAVSGYSPPQMTAMGMIPQHRPSTPMTTAK